MPKQIVIAEQHRIAAVFSEDQIQELIVATGSHQVSDVYLGVVENVLPGIDAAFVNIGDSERNGFIHVSDLGPLKLRRTAGSITELLVPQQKVLVQVMKEPTGNKGPRLTGNISLPGRYLVLMPHGKGVNLSRRIRNENERNRLRALAILIKPAGMGVVVRTEAEGMPEEAIIEDLEVLQKQWEAILQEASTARAPALLNRDDDFIQRVLRDVYSVDVNRIVVDSHTGLRRVKQHLTSWGGGKTTQGVLIDHHRDRIPILEYFRINAAIREALKPRVDLPSGGYIIIERTEALTVIDVNSGSFTRSATARETVLWTNCEAATEIARQLRLRNIAGVIVVDFIDMDSNRDKLQVLEHFNKALRADKARPQIAQLSELGLVELTRKRQGKNIYELFGRPCQTCGGLGHLVHLPGEPESSVGESLERSSVAALQDYRGGDTSRGRRREQPLPEAGISTWEEPGEEEAEEPDLVYHPSYQELGANNRRRRRRRIGEDFSKDRKGWEDGSSSGGFEADDDDASSDESFAGGRGREREQRGRRGRNGKTLQPATLNREVTPRDLEPREPEYSRESGSPPEPPLLEDKRGRSRREPKPPAAPPEVISVEMTADEQEVYAWMGISPIVLSNQEVKNPKSAVISVVLPGQSPAPLPNGSSGLETPVSVPKPIRVSATPLEEVGDVGTRRLESQESPVQVEESLVQVEEAAVQVEEDGDGAGDAASSGPRRRRRRSSASLGE